MIDENLNNRRTYGLGQCENKYNERVNSLRSAPIYFENVHHRDATITVRVRRRRRLARLGEKSSSLLRESSNPKCCSESRTSRTYMYRTYEMYDYSSYPLFIRRPDFAIRALSFLRKIRHS